MSVTALSQISNRMLCSRKLSYNLAIEDISLWTDCSGYGAMFAMGETRTSDRITAISTFITAIAAVVALIVACLQLGETRTEDRGKHILEMLDRFQSPPFLAMRSRLAAARIDTQHDQLRKLDPAKAPQEMYEALGFCEDLGLVTNSGYLDKHDVWVEFGSWLFVISKDAKPVVDDEQQKDTSAFRECSTLMDSLTAIEEKDGKSRNLHLGESDIYNEYDADLIDPPAAVSLPKQN